MRSTETTRSPSAVSKTITPWVERPAMRAAAERAVALAPTHGDDTFSAATGDAVFVRRRALAVTVLGDREHKLLGRRHFHIALLAELDGAARLFGVGRAFLRLPVDAATNRARTLEIRRALAGARL